MLKKSKVFKYIQQNLISLLIKIYRMYSRMGIHIYIYIYQGKKATFLLFKKKGKTY